MKQMRFFSLIIFIIIIIFSKTVLAQVPILPDFHADPSARYWDGTLWLYPSTDEPGSSSWQQMKRWHVYSSLDLKKWINHGQILSLEEISWAQERAYAPDCMRRNGKYYFYFPADYQIGVAVSDSPTGPFKDALGHPLINRGESGTRVMDPCIFLDDDGQAYLYFGQDELRVVKLNEDMISKDGEIIKIAAEHFHEGVWVHKTKNQYYLSYASSRGDKVANLLEYSIGKSPYGPFEYKGIIMDNRSRNVHHSIVEIEGQWYLFYHIEGPSPYERRVCMEKLFYDGNGNIIEVKMSEKKIED